MWIAQQLLRPFETNGLYGLKYGLSGGFAEFHFRIDARTGEKADDLCRRKARTGFFFYKFHRGGDFGVVPR